MKCYYHRFIQVKEVEDGYWFKCAYCKTQVHGRINAANHPGKERPVVQPGTTVEAPKERRGD